jgi:hypothetical protein
VGGHIVKAPMPAHDAVQGRSFEGQLSDLDRIGAAEFHRKLSENGDEVRLHQKRKETSGKVAVGARLFGFLGTNRPVDIAQRGLDSLH